MGYRETNNQSPDVLYPVHALSVIRFRSDDLFKLSVPKPMNQFDVLGLAIFLPPDRYPFDSKEAILRKQKSSNWYR